MGEMGLSGEIRPVSHINMRITEAVRLGASRIYTPNDASVGSKAKIVQITNVRDLLKYVDKA